MLLRTDSYGISPTRRSNSWRESSPIEKKKTNLHCLLTCRIGCIAQLVEHWAFNLVVAGSSPAIPKKTTHSIFLVDFALFQRPNFPND